MSRFESSRFVRNPQVMHVDVLKSACDALGWQYTIHDNILTVSDAKQKSRLYGEFALKLNLTTNEVTYNTYYMPQCHPKGIMESERNLMTTTEAAKYLGLRPSYLYKLMMRRAIPYYKPNGKLCFFAREDLDAWLRRVRVKSQEEIDSGAARYLVGRERNR